MKMKDTEAMKAAEKAYKGMSHEEKWRWHYGTEFSDTELQDKRRERYKFTGELWKESEKKIKSFRDVSWGLWGGTLISPILLGVSERDLIRLVTLSSIVLWIAYKMYVKSESREVERKGNLGWPSDLLWSEKSKK